MSVRVLIADDHPAIRSGLRLMLETDPGIVVVGEAGDGAVAVTNARALRPDVVLMDIRMPGVDGIEATRTITREGLADVLVLTTFDIDEYVFGALRAGAAGFLLKSTDAPALIDAVRRVGAGEGVVAPEVTRRLLAAFVSSGGGPPEGAVASGHGSEGHVRRAGTTTLSELTAREREVLACLGHGMSNAELAAELMITEATVKTYVSRVLAKLGCASRVQAAILAREVGMV